MKRPFYNAVHSLLFNQRHLVTALCVRLGFLFSDKTYLKIMHRLELHKKLDLDNPQTYNEKLQWLKLYYHRPDFVTMADKEAVKAYVASKIGSEYVVPLLGKWNRVKDIDWDMLPNQFVLKTNHDGGNNGIVICKDKSSFNKRKAKKRLKWSLRRNTFLLGREWPYKDIPRKVFAEQYMENFGSKDLLDYKFLCFDGKVKLLFVASERQGKTGVKFDFFDEDFNHLNLFQSHPNAKKTPEKPKNFQLMKEIAEKLSAGIPHVRVDLYEVNGKVYFGEYTFFSLGGWAGFHPQKYDYLLGSYIQLPTEKIV